MSFSLELIVTRDGQQARGFSRSNIIYYQFPISTQYAQTTRNVTDVTTRFAPTKSINSHSFCGSQCPLKLVATSASARETVMNLEAVG